MESSKIKILNIALELLTKKGYDNVGVQTICEMSGLTKPTLYYHFGNKAGLLKALFKEYCAKLDAPLCDCAKYVPNPNSYEKDVFPILVNVCKAYFKFAKSNTKFYQLMLSSFYSPQNSEFNSVAKEFTNKQFEIIKNMFNEISKTHLNLKRHEQYLTYTFLGTINSCIMFNVNDISPEELVKQFMHGIFS